MVYEVEAGSAIEQVEGFCRHLTDNGVFSDGSQPQRGWVTTQLNLDAAYISTRLEQAGYSSTQTVTTVVQLLELWNVFRTCIACELSNPIVSVRGEGNPRFQEFKNREQILEGIATGPGLADLGATVSGGLSDMLLATGVSRDRKEAVVDDTDHILHRIRRGQFVDPTTGEPTTEEDWRSQV